MDGTQNTPANPTASRAILVTLLILGCGVLGLISGIFTGVVGGLPLYLSVVAGAGAFLSTLTVGGMLMIFLVGGRS